MPKISRHASTLLSQILTITVLAALVTGLFVLPMLLRYLLPLFGKAGHVYTPVLIILYAALIPAITAAVSLLRLIGNVKADNVFCAGSVACLRLISWCCFAEGVVFFALGFFLTSAFAVAFAALFMGVVMRVVKNVIDQGTVIKSENDFTI